MIRCEKCNINICDDAIVCPLCQNVLDVSENSENGNINGRSVMYPTVENKIRKRRLVVKLVIFTAVVTELILMLINVKTYNDFWWSKVTGVIFIYVCLVVAWLLDGTMGHRRKLEMLTVSTCMLLLVLNMLLGGVGWSLIYGIPCTVLSMELVIMVLVIFNRRSWQEYILLQILMLIISIVNLIFSIVWDISDYIISIIAIGVAGTVIFGMFLFGKNRTVNEVSRRFKV